MKTVNMTDLIEKAREDEMQTFCPCVEWVRKFDEARGIHHPACDGHGRRKWRQGATPLPIKQLQQDGESATEEDDLTAILNIMGLDPECDGNHPRGSCYREKLDAALSDISARLSVAIEALEKYENKSNWIHGEDAPRFADIFVCVTPANGYDIAAQALSKIKGRRMK